MLNQVTIMGRLTRDPELRRTSSGKAVVSFSLAVEDDYKPQDGEREVDFIDFVAWDNTAEFVAKYFTKGRTAIATGKLKVRNFTDKDNNKRKATEVVCDTVYFGDSKPKDDGANAQQGGGQQQGYSQQQNAPQQGGGQQQGYSQQQNAPQQGGGQQQGYSQQQNAPQQGGYQQQGYSRQQNAPQQGGYQQQGYSRQQNAPQQGGYQQQGYSRQLPF